MSGPIRVLVVDDHPAVRAGLRALIDAEPDMRAVGEACDEYTLMPAVRRAEPDVVLLDYRLSGANGLVLCRRLKSGVFPRRVVIYSAFAGHSLALPARLAGADALVDKAVSPRELAAVIRGADAGDPVAPAVTPDALSVAADLLRVEDLPILGMLAHGATPGDVARTLDISASELDQRVERMLGVLA